MRSLLHRLITTIKYIFSMDIRSLALFRVGISIILFWQLLLQFSNLSVFYTDNGAWPREVLHGNLGIFNVYSLNGSYEFQLFLLVVTAIVCVCFFLGYHTRTATILLWILQISIQDRNQFIIHGGDALLRMVLFWSIFLPLGATHSIDSIGKFLDRRSYRVFSVGTVAFLLQIFFLYFFAALLKSDPQWHQSGTAVYYALRFEQLATPFSSLLLAAPPIVLQFLTHAVWYTEALVPFLFFIPFFKGQLRLLAIGILSAFHIGLGIFLNLGTFVFIPIISLAALLPTSFWNLFSRLLQKYFPVKLTIYFDDDCGFCRRSVAVISYCLLLYGVRVMPAQTVPKMYEKMQQHNSWIVSDSAGKLYFKEQALARLLRSSPLFFIISPIFFWKPVIRLGDRVYETIVKHRFIACSVPKPQKKLVQNLHMVAKTIAMGSVVIFLVSITFWNITTISRSFHMPTLLENLCRSLHINQSWDMFAPYPSLEDGWYVMPATRNNGKTIDLFTQQQVTWEKPPLTSSMYKDERWTKYMMNLSYKSNSDYRPYFARYLCTRWNKSHVGEDHVKNVTIYFMLKEIPKPFSASTTPARPIALGDYACL